MEKVDALIEAKWVIPVRPAGVVLPDHAVAVRDASIVAVLPLGEARARYEPERRFILEHHALIPGLVNLHTRAARTLFRGLATHQPAGHLLGLESRHLSAQFVYDGTSLACMEMLRGGVTCFSDMYFYPGHAAQAALAFGMRAVLGLTCIDIPSAYASDFEDYLAKGLATRDEYRGEPLISFSMAPWRSDAVSDASLARAVTMSEELDLPIHMRLHRTDDELRASLAQHGVRPLARMEQQGVLGPRLISVDAVQLEPGEIRALARFGASVANCPSSNLKHAGSAAPFDELRQAGVNVGLGTDAPTDHSRLDLFGEMRQTALTSSAPAWQILEAATLGGARALGIDSRIGSIAAGKEADLCAIAFDTPQSSPCYAPISQLVTTADRSSVSHVWVRGRLVHDKNLTLLEAPEVSARVAFWQNKFASETNA